MHETQSNLIIKLLKFHTESFEKYIKFLEELKKKLKREKNDENKSNEKNTDKKDLNKENTNKEKDEEKNEKNNKKTNNKNSKKIPINNHKQEKIKISINYFFIYNLRFILKILTMLIIIMFYYIIIDIYNKNRRKNILKFDDFITSLFDIFLNSFFSFGIIKNQTIYFTDFIIEKNEKINQLNSNYESITFNNEIYTKDNLTLLQNKKYYFEIPNEEIIKIKKNR